MKICINGGHFSDKDSGAISELGLQESEVTYRLMELVSYYLQQDDYDTLMVYENELYKITDESNLWGADLFVSIHCNSAYNPEIKGTETFYLRQSNESANLARLVQKQIVSNLGTVDRGINTAEFVVLRDTHCPGILIETAFLSNEADAKLLADENQLDKFAAAIASGIVDYYASASLRECVA